MNPYVFLSLYFMFPLAFKKRVFSFLPLIEVYLDEHLDAKDLRIHSYNGRTYYGLVACFQCPRPLDSAERELLVRELKAALALCYLQIALPKHVVVEVQSCGEFINYIHSLEVPESIQREAMSSSDTLEELSEDTNDNVVTLVFDLQRVTDELKHLLGKMRLLKRYEEVFKRFLRAVDMFSSAVSQADYVVYVFLLATTVEVLASAIKAFIERSQLVFRASVKDVKDSIVEQYRLYIEYNGHRYGLIDLRNAIAHGKPEM